MKRASPLGRPDKCLLVLLEARHTSGAALGSGTIVGASWVCALPGALDERRTIRMVCRDGSAVGREPMSVLAPLLLGGVLVLRKPERRSCLARMSGLLFRLPTPGTVQPAGPKELIKLIGVDSDAVAHPQNAAVGNQAGSDPSVDRINAEAITGSKL